ncbi:MAG: ATP-binding cassette domain-containing protein [Tissierellia bacterium]|nr:ATP-binding cassette domain-containing protein [Tissierellia bacterium]
MCLLNIEKLTKSFVQGQEKLIPIHELSLTINPGDFITIMGRSGTGKTTLLNLIALFLNPDAGHILYKGEKLNEFDDEEASEYRNRRIGFLIQTVPLIPSLTVEENIILPHFLWERTDDPREKAKELMHEFNIIKLKGEPIDNLSGGERKRVGLARALINEPEILLLDEPSSDLDEQTAKQIIDFLVDRNKRGLSILLVTHDRAFQRISNRSYQLLDGSLHSI